MNINYNFIVCREKAICNMLPFPVVECLLPNPGRSTPIQTSHPSLHVGYSHLQSSLDLLDFIFLHHPTTSQLWDSPLEKWLSTWSSHAWKPQWQQLLRLEGIKPNCSLGLWHSAHLFIHPYRALLWSNCASTCLAMFSHRVPGAKTGKSEDPVKAGGYFIPNVRSWSYLRATAPSYLLY